MNKKLAHIKYLSLKTAPYLGHLEIFTERCIRGWVAHQKDASSRLGISLLLSDVEVLSIDIDGVRSDLNEYIGRPGAYVFSKDFVDHEFFTLVEQALINVYNRTRVDLNQSYGSPFSFKLVITNYTGNVDDDITGTFGFKLPENFSRERSLVEWVEYFLLSPDRIYNDCSDEERGIIFSGLFNFDYYVHSINPPGKIGLNEAVRHYIRSGEAQNIRPSLAFNPSFYRNRYSDLSEIKCTLLFHYISYGRTEGRLPTEASLLISSGLDRDIADKLKWPYRASGIYEDDHRSLEMLLSDETTFDPSKAFSSHYYNLLNEDVRKAGVIPAFHYLTSGLSEGRKTSIDFFESFSINLKNYDPNKTIVLVGAHELSKTGAPIVAIEVARALSKAHNIAFVSWGTGILKEALRDEFFAVVAADCVPSLINLALDEIQKYSKPILGIFSSVECDRLLQILSEQNMPLVSLVHEYSEYTFPYSKRCSPFVYCDFVVFSSNHLKESWEPVFSGLCFPEDRLFVLPQPKAVVEGGGLSSKSEARIKLSEYLGFDISERIIVMGAGHVQIRKGTDLFLQLGKNISTAQPGKFLFVWIGEAPLKDDINFGVWHQTYLQKAIKDSTDVLVLPPGGIYNDLQSASDAFLLTSRLDPLPNVVLDAIYCGSVIFYFDGASGIVEVLPSIEEDKFHSSPYLDVFDMKDKIIEYFDKWPNKRAVIAVNEKNKVILGSENQNYDSYVNNILLKVYGLERKI